MIYDFAPMEGITNFIYRKAHRDFYPGIDFYYTPFLTPKLKCVLSEKELREISPENNEGVNLIPQILTNNAEGFTAAEHLLYDQGYREVNLNLGCPSATVTKKKKGSGFLAYPDALDAFLKEITLNARADISIKTRIGISDPDEFEQLLPIFNKYPIKRLIIHPRTKDEFYSGKVHMEIFDYARTNARMPICYNGELWHEDDILRLRQEFPDLGEVMLGRGLIGNPGIVDNMKNQEEGAFTFDKKRFLLFIDRLISDFRLNYSGDHVVLMHLKEYSPLISTSHQNEKLRKKLIKSKSIEEFYNILAVML